jgi:hypothetical protein
VRPREDGAVDRLDEDLVRRLVGEHLQQHPTTRTLHLTDATFHAAVEAARTTLVAVTASMRAAGLPLWQAEAVLRGALDQLLGDQLLAEQRRQVELAAALALAPPSTGRGVPT